MIVDDDEFVRESTQQSLMYQTKLLLATYLSKKAAECKAEDFALSIKKLDIPILYYVKASTGEESIKVYQNLLNKNCEVQLILMDINMGKDNMKGYEAAAKIRSIEKERENLPQPVIIIGHSGGDASALMQSKKVINFMNGCKDKPLDLEIMKKLVKALLLGSKT